MPTPQPASKMYQFDNAYFERFISYKITRFSCCYPKTLKYGLESH